MKRTSQMAELNNLTEIVKNFKKVRIDEPIVQKPRYSNGNRKQNVLKDLRMLYGEVVTPSKKKTSLNTD
jgi:hypothetical protein